MSDNYVYVAEAYDEHGNRIERIVHKNKHDAHEDISVSTSLNGPVDITVEREKLYLGEDTEWHIER